MLRLMAAVLASACSLPLSASAAGIFLHSAADEQQAVAAKKAYSEVELRKSLDAERQAIAAMSAREQAAVERDQHSLRDRELLAVLMNTTRQSSWDFLENTVIAARLEHLIGTAGGQRDARSSARTFSSFMDAIARNELKFSAARETYYLASGGKVRPTCPITDSQRPPKEDRALRLSFADVEAGCSDILSARDEVAKLIAPSSLLGGKDQELAVAAREISAVKGKLAAAANDVQAKVEESRRAGNASKVAELAAGLKAQLLDLEEFARRPSSLDPVLSKLRLEALHAKVLAQKDLLEAFLKALSGDASAGGDRALTLMADVSGLARSGASDVPPPVAGLVLQTEFLRLAAQNYEKQIARANERVELLSKQRAALVNEIMFLADAVRQLESYGASPSAGPTGSPASAANRPPSAAACPRAGALYDDFVKATPTCKATLARALASVSNARTLGRAEHEKLEYMLLAQAYEAALDDSETAIAQVDSLIRIPLEQLAKAYGSGIRAEELSNVINALGLSAIAVRVR